MNDYDMIATLVKIDNSGEKEIDMRQVFNGYDAIKLMEDYAMDHADDDEWVAEKYAMFASGEDDKGKVQAGRLLEKNGEISERFLKGGYEIQLRLYDSAYSESEGSTGFEVGDKVEVKSKIHHSWFAGHDPVPVGTLCEVVGVDKPLKGLIKIRLEDGSTVSVPERGLKIAGTDDEPWSSIDEPEVDRKHEGPEEYYKRSTSVYGSPAWTGD